MKTIDEKAKEAADKEAEKEQYEKDKAQETADMEADRAFLDELTKLGEEKAKEFDQRSKTRSAEITSLNEAIGILKSGVQPNAMVQTKKAFMQGEPTAKEARGHWVWVEDSVASGSGSTLSSKAMNFLQVQAQKTEA